MLTSPSFRGYPEFMMIRAFSLTFGVAQFRLIGALACGGLKIFDTSGRPKPTS